MRLFPQAAFPVFYMSAKQIDQAELAEQTSQPTMHLFFFSFCCGLKRKKSLFTGLIIKNFLTDGRDHFLTALIATMGNGGGEKIHSTKKFKPN